MSDVSNGSPIDFEATGDEREKEGHFETWEGRTESFHRTNLFHHNLMEKPEIVWPARHLLGRVLYIVADKVHSAIILQPFIQLLPLACHRQN